MVYAPATDKTSSALEKHFEYFRENIMGQNAYFNGPFGEKKIIYADWTASGRSYRPIEDIFMEEIYPLVANTHTETNFMGSTMTKAYQQARNVIKNHVGAYDSDVLISAGSGMTGIVNKLQRILGLRVHEDYRSLAMNDQQDRPVVFVSHMEHHSNQTSWLECLVDMVIVPANEDGLVCLETFQEEVHKYADRKLKIAAVTSCSNVTGIKTPYHQIARIMHEAGGLCFVDFACSAPYIDICMRPEDPLEHLDAIYFSPHKFLGGPGSSGILIFCPKMYRNQIPDNPGGGTVDWTNPWGKHKYHDSIEAREDGGTPPFLQTMRVALAIQLKERMGVQKILEREKEMLDIIWSKLHNVNGINILAGHVPERLGVISFYIDDLHYNLGVQLLNDRYGIQTRGGCSCAGTYGHYLLHVDQTTSDSITCQISSGDLSAKPGWIRMSIHPTMTNEEVHYICDAIIALNTHHADWAEEYVYSPKSNEFTHKSFQVDPGTEKVERWFNTL